MKAALYNLIELQEVDNELQALEDLKGDLPQQVEGLRKELEAYQSNLNKLKSDLEKAKKSRLHWEVEVKVQQDKLKKYQDQLFAVKTNKEYDAITVEIDSTKEKIDEGETKILEFIESEEKLTEEVRNIQGHIRVLKENLKDKEKELEVKIRDTESDSQILEKRRKALIEKIRKPLLYQYERIRKAKGELTVVGVNKYACEGCYAAIPPQKVLEIRSMEQLILCESCGRILVNKSYHDAVTT